MSWNGPLSELADDQRAVSAVIGFILIFGILILTLTTYQAQIVPQQNAQTEFKHFEDTRDELIEVRNSISRTGQTGDPQFPSVQLGPIYQSRILTINSAPASGTLQTSEEYNISIYNESGESVTVSTRFIEYQPGYHEITIGSTWYENSVLYTDTSRENNTIIEEQNIVTGGNELKITAIENEFQETGTSRTTIGMNRNQSDIELPNDENGNLTIEIPTRLNETYWDTLEDEVDGDPISYDGVTEEGETNRLILNATNSSNVDINSVEIDS